MEKNWDKKYHVESSMPNDDKGFHAFLGRFQPLHDGHKQLFQQFLNEGKNVCIMVRDIKKAKTKVDMFLFIIFSVRRFYIYDCYIYYLSLSAYR
jgi:hypothetical protein